MKAVKVKATTVGKVRKKAHVRKIKTAADGNGAGGEMKKVKKKSTQSTGGGFKSPMHEKMHNLRMMRGKNKKV